MEFKFVHQNFNVLDLRRSLDFYREALGLVEQRRIEKDDFTIVYVGAAGQDFQLELTWMHDRKEPYNLGDEEFHLALRTDDFEAARRLHEKMGCVAMENQQMHIYFIQDPDGYWIEILPPKAAASPKGEKNA